jgi:hypothetical protein
MTPRRSILAPALLAATTGAVASDVKVLNDPAGDAVIRRTDAGNSGPLNPLSVLPDVTKLTLSGWTSPTAAIDPYSGSVVSNNPHLFRLQISFVGVVNPPGTLDVSNFNPFHFGDSPLFGFVEFDADRNRDTGGELGGPALHRYLAVVGRFGRLPGGSLGSERGVRWGTELDGIYATTPQYERTGTDFALVFCGCFPTVVESEGGNGNGIFEAGETWIVSGNFWQRSGGYRLASFMTGGPDVGLWQPSVKLRWSHDISTNRTTVTLVEALTMTGAAQLAGSPQVQQPNYNYGPGDHTSVEEAMRDLADFATFTPPTPGSPEWDLSIGWAGVPIEGELLDPTRWRAKGVFGTSYAAYQPGAPYVWTDVGFEDPPGDLNHDGLVNVSDRILVRQQYALGAVQIPNFGANFSVYDINGDGKIDLLDSLWYCPPDVNDDLQLNIADFSTFLQGFSAGAAWADINRDGVLNIADYTLFLQLFGAGCP